MRKKWNQKLGEEGSSVLKGFLVFIVTAGVLVILSALVMLWTDLDENIITAMVCVVLAIASLLGGFVGGKTAGKAGIKIGGYIGIASALFFVFAGVIVNGLYFTWLAPLKASLCIIMGAIGGIVGANLAQKRKF